MSRSCGGINALSDSTCDLAIMRARPAGVVGLARFSRKEVLLCQTQQRRQRGLLPQVTPCGGATKSRRIRPSGFTSDSKSWRSTPRLLDPCPVIRKRGGAPSRLGRRRTLFANRCGTVASAALDWSAGWWPTRPSATFWSWTSCIVFGSSLARPAGAFAPAGFFLTTGWPVAVDPREARPIGCYLPCTPIGRAPAV